MSFSVDAVRLELTVKSEDEAARRHRRQVSCARGIRGVPFGDLARIVDRTWRETPPQLPGDAPALSALYSTAWEDGLAAVGLLAAAAPDAPDAALALARDLAGRVDDPLTADALGWLVLGPLAGLTGQPYPAVVDGLAQHPRDDVRRAVVAGALAFTPTVVEGPAAAGLRARVGQARIRISDRVDPAVVGWVVATFRRDEAVGRSVRRLLKAWGDEDPAGLLAFAASVPGGLPGPLAAEVRAFRGRG